jgi:hypothetical protein
MGVPRRPTSASTPPSHLDGEEFSISHIIVPLSRDKTMGEESTGVQLLVLGWIKMGAVVNQHFKSENTWSAAGNHVKGTLGEVSA